MEWRCRDCDARFSLEELTDEMDDAMEEALANIPCNRL
ncbi:MAG: dual CXXC motif small (seleno)protein [Desulfococcaceae bacterium]